MTVVNYGVVNSVTTPVDTAMQVIIPQMLNYAELRIQKDLDLQQAATSNTSYALTAGVNTVTIDVNLFQAIQTISLANGSMKNRLLPTSKEFIQSVYTDSSTQYWGPPTYFAIQGGNASDGNQAIVILVGPYPDINYPLVIIGTQWLPSLYATAGTDGLGTTYISSNYPDLLIQASMVYVAQFQRNFLPTSNDPQMPGSYEVQYQTLLKSAIELENRKKFRAAAWSSQSQSPVATPNR